MRASLSEMNISVTGDAGRRQTAILHVQQYRHACSCRLRRPAGHVALLAGQRRMLALEERRGCLVVKVDTLKLAEGDTFTRGTQLSRMDISGSSHRSSSGRENRHHVWPQAHLNWWQRFCDNAHRRAPRVCQSTRTGLRVIERGFTETRIVVTRLAVLLERAAVDVGVARRTCLPSAPLHRRLLYGS